MGKRAGAFKRFAYKWPLGLGCGQVTWACNSDGPMCVHKGHPQQLVHNGQAWTPNYWGRMDAR